MTPLPPVEERAVMRWRGDAVGIDDRFVQWEEIGSGGFGAVYRVYDRELARHVAIKLLHDSHAHDPALVETLKREVIVSRGLRHPNICPIHDLYLGERGVGTVMDLIQGVELRSWLDENRNRLLDTAPLRLELLRKLTEALAIAHTFIVHRDLKPSNIFLLDGDPLRPLIMDFGTSVVGQTAKGTTSVAGTPRYMAPEQWENPEWVDHRSDLFAFGIMAYEMFTNRTPATSLKDILKTFRPPRPRMSEIPLPSSFCAAVPPALDRLIIQLMAYDQRERPQSAREMLDVLKMIEMRPPDLAGKGSLAGPALEAVTISLEGGTFYLGSPTNVESSHEKPATKVTLTPFRILAHPVTNAQYLAFLRTTGYAPPARYSNPAFSFPDHPVVGITFEDARTYAHWVGGELPTEAQWEYAAKGGQTFPLYPWGNEPVTSLRANIGAIHATTTPVGAHPGGRNPWGLEEMCGNVWEWCLDHWAPDAYRRIPKGSRDPVTTVGNPEVRVVRGGAFNSLANQGRCAFRFHAPIRQASPFIGFRVVFPSA